MQKTSIMAILLCIAVVSAHGDIASKSYVESVASGVQAKIDTRASNDGYTPERVLQTDASGNVTADFLKTDMISDGAVTNSRMASGLGLDKMDVGELPTSGKHIMIWNAATQKYVFEPLIELAEIDLDAIDEYLSAGFPSSFAGYGLDRQFCAGEDTNGNWFGVEEGGSCSDPEFAGMTRGDWYIDIPSPINVKIEGRALCNGKTGRYAQPGDLDESFGGRWCWCKMTSPAASNWVFSYDLGSPSACRMLCAFDCGSTVRSDADFRSAVYGSVELE